MFSRAVRWPVRRRRATASGRASSSVTRVALEHLGEVGADVVEVDSSSRGGRRRVDVGRLDEHERVALEHGVADGDADEPRTYAGDGGADDVLHLHRLHHEQLLAGARRRRPRRTARLHDGALHRGDGTATVPVGPVARSAGRRAGAAVGAGRRLCRSRARPAGRRVDSAPASRGAAGGRRPSAKYRCAAASPAASDELGQVVVDEAGRGRRRPRRRGGRGGSAGSRRWSPRPRCGTRPAPGRPWPAASARSARAACGRSPWPAASRSWGSCGSRRSRTCRRARRARRQLERGQRAAGRAGRRRRRAIVSMFTRAWMATPRGAGTRRLGRARGRPASRPPASSQLGRTRSTPVTSSVTVCSTCSRGLASMNAKRVAAAVGARPGTRTCRGWRSRPRAASRTRGVDAARSRTRRVERRARARSRQLLVAALEAAVALAAGG